MAKKLAAGSTRNSKGLNPKYRGVKAFHGQLISSGSIIVRQKSTTFHPGQNAMLGKDNTIFSTADGYVRCYTVRKFAGKARRLHAKLREKTLKTFGIEKV